MPKVERWAFFYHTPVPMACLQRNSCNIRWRTTSDDRVPGAADVSKLSERGRPNAHPMERRPGAAPEMNKTHNISYLRKRSQ